MPFAVVTDRHLPTREAANGGYLLPTCSVMRKNYKHPFKNGPPDMACTASYDDEGDEYEYVEAVDERDPETVAMDIFAQYAGGNSIPLVSGSRTWVLRALQALERHYHDLRRDDRKRRERLESLSAELTERLEETAQALVAERMARKAADAELRRVRAALDAEAAARTGFETHDKALRRTQTAVERERDQFSAALRGTEAQLADMQQRFTVADAAARSFAQQAAEAQEQARVALRESQEAHAAKVALQKCLLREKDYRLSEEAGYRLDSVVQITPTHPTITVFGGVARRPPPEGNTRIMLDPWRKGTL